MDSDAASSLPDLETLAKGQPDPTPRGFLKAWNPITQRVAWQVETSGPWAGHPSATWNGGGVMSSAGGLVFQGRATGELAILDADTGDQLHSIKVGTGMVAAPMTYSIEGEQYIAIMAGVGGSMARMHSPGSAAHRYGNQGRIVVFKLGGANVPLRAELKHAQGGIPVPPITRRGTLEQRDQGGRLFQRNCSKCHLNTGEGGLPDLRKMNKETHTEFMDILLKGTRANRGMGSFIGQLSVEQVEAIHVYLIDLAWKAYETEHHPQDPHKPDAAHQSAEKKHDRF
jgi:quinohemoprotein ethanol dehydrogenase